jgi:hypothetical protein
MVLGLTEPLSEMSTRNLLGVKVRPERKARLTAICKPIVLKMLESRRVIILLVSTACYSNTLKDSTESTLLIPTNS